MIFDQYRAWRIALDFCAGSMEDKRAQWEGQGPQLTRDMSLLVLGTLAGLQEGLSHSPESTHRKRTLWQGQPYSKARGCFECTVESAIEISSSQVSKDPCQDPKQRARTLKRHFSGTVWYREPQAEWNLVWLGGHFQQLGEKRHSCGPCEGCVVIRRGQGRHKCSYGPTALEGHLWGQLLAERRKIVPWAEDHVNRLQATHRNSSGAGRKINHCTQTRAQTRALMQWC